MPPPLNISNISEKLCPSQASASPESEKLEAPAPKSTIDADGLSWPAIGSKTRKTESTEERDSRIARVADSVENILTVGPVF